MMVWAVLTVWLAVPELALSKALPGYDAVSVLAPVVVDVREHEYVTVAATPPVGVVSVQTACAVRDRDGTGDRGAAAGPGDADVNDVGRVDGGGIRQVGGDRGRRPHDGRSRHDQRGGADHRVQRAAADPLPGFHRLAVIVSGKVPPGVATVVATVTVTVTVAPAATDVAQVEVKHAPAGRPPIAEIEMPRTLEGEPFVTETE